ncbi:hypothetical protein ALC62_05934 [Cyphomyrmex costatus]|uniref:Uncharacterized protein n=1 Tax=Cyphomyrmex costatus TaxID=456900 RepID=A0A195CRD9_9HYME|nr:hypothetical protein ALC62_05934 [Cyphomyrmex costatus]
MSKAGNRFGGKSVATTLSLGDTEVVQILTCKFTVSRTPPLALRKYTFVRKTSLDPECGPRFRSNHRSRNDSNWYQLRRVTLDISTSFETREFAATFPYKRGGEILHRGLYIYT